jgi:hypothetical protein
MGHLSSADFTLAFLLPSDELFFADFTILSGDSFVLTQVIERLHLLPVINDSV